MPPAVRYYFFIVVENLIPLAGYFFLGWTFKDIFLFYAVELCAYELTIIPRIGFYVFTSDEYRDVGSFIKKYGILISWILYSLMITLAVIKAEKVSKAPWRSIQMAISPGIIYPTTVSSTVPKAVFTIPMDLVKHPNKNPIKIINTVLLRP